MGEGNQARENAQVKLTACVGTRDRSLGEFDALRIVERAEREQLLVDRGTPFVRDAALLESREVGAESAQERILRGLPLPGINSRRPPRSRSRRRPR